MQEMMATDANLKMVLTPVRSAQCQVYWGLKWIPPGLPGRRKFHQDILQWEGE